MQQLVCPQCTADVPAANINIEKVLAVCPACNTVFGFDFLAGEGDDAKTKAKSKSKARARPLHPPRGFNIAERADGWVMSWRWFTPAVIPITFFVIVWNGFLVLWYMMVPGFGGGFGGMSVFFMLFPLLHVGVGVVLTYNVLATYLNRTTITLTADHINVRSLPVPHPWRDVSLRMEDIAQVYVKRNHVTGLGKSGPNYDVMVQRYTANDTVLVSSLADSTLALFIEQELERYLEIEDEPVFGEVKGRG
jgi:hypothetical protein